MLPQLDDYDWAEVFGEGSGVNCGRIEPRRIPGDIWERGLWAEREIGYTIIKGHSLLELAPKFEIMRRAGVPATERLPSGKFWKEARRLIGILETEELQFSLPCECTQ